MGRLVGYFESEERMILKMGSISTNPSEFPRKTFPPVPMIRMKLHGKYFRLLGNYDQSAQKNSTRKLGLSGMENILGFWGIMTKAQQM